MLAFLCLVRYLFVWYTVDGFVVLGHALEHSVHGHGRRVPKSHHPPRQHSQHPRRGTAAPSRPQLCATHGGAPRYLCIKDQVWRVIVSMSGAHISMKPFVPLAVQRFALHSSLFFKIHNLCFFVLQIHFSYFLRPHPSLRPKPQLGVSLERLRVTN